MRKKEQLLMLALGAIALFIISIPLFGNFIFSVQDHDTFFHTQRIISIKNALEAGQFPVRIYSEVYNGYGYGAPLFYPELFLYFPAILYMIGVPIAACYNIFLMTINVATLMVAHYAFSNITKSGQIGFIAAILYTTSTYRLVDMYTRSSVGELLALIFVPLVLCALVMIKRGEYQMWWVMAIAFTGSLQSHVLTFVMMVILAVIYGILHIRKFLVPKAILAVCKAVGIVALVNAWFLYPFLQGSQLELNAFAPSYHFWLTGAYVVQLFDLSLSGATGVELYNNEIAGSMPKTPGLLLLTGAMLLVVALVIHWEELKEERRSFVGYLFAGGFSALLITDLFPWEQIRNIDILARFFEKFQFIWRFNVYGILFLSVAGAGGLYYMFLKDAKEYRKIFSSICMLISAVPFIFINQYVQKAEHTGNYDVVYKSYMDDMYYTVDFSREYEQFSARSNVASLTVDNVERFYLGMELDYGFTEWTISDEEYYIELPILYYPGYHAYIDGSEIKLTPNEQGLVRVPVTAEQKSGHLLIQYEESGMMLFCDIISLFTIGGIVIIVILNYIKKRKK